MASLEDSRSADTVVQMQSVNKRLERDPMFGISTAIRRVDHSK